jgi:glycosyltransferase involved in cell wall biosynthesis
MNPLLSVVVPCYNEAEVLWETHGRLQAVMSRLGDLEFELIYVDDGSRDATPCILEEILALDPHVRVIRFSRNFGHQTAVTAGLEHASGDAVVIIDADLQDPPDVIETMVARWREGYHVAYGVRTDREGETRLKLLSAKAFYRLLNRLSETQIPLDSGDFRLMDRAVVEALRSMPERDRFVRGMVAWAGFRQIAVPYRRAPRFAGRSKYPLLAMVRFALDGVTSFSRAPLRAVTWMGLVVLGLALAAIAYALVMGLFTDMSVTGWMAVFMAVLFIGGAQLISLGVIGEYVGRIYGEAKRRPLYVVQEALGFDRSIDTGVERAALDFGFTPVPGDVTLRRLRDNGPRRPMRDTESPLPRYHEPAVTRSDESVA